MGSGKYYAVAVGRKPGIYRTWEECKKQINKFSKAKYKSFSSEHEAKKYLKINGIMGETGMTNIKNKFDINHHNSSSRRMNAQLSKDGQRYSVEAHDEDSLNRKYKAKLIAINGGEPRKLEYGSSQDGVLGITYVTEDYSKFKELLGNRDISRSEVNAIKNSIMTNGWLHDPILVNENFEIIDGQHRFVALKELEYPIEYMVVKGITAKECQSLNSVQKNWNQKDFINFYARNNNESYMYLKELIDKFPKLKVNTIYFALRDSANISTAEIKTGRFECSHERYLRALDTLAFVDSLSSFTSKVMGRVDYLNVGLAFIYMYEEKCDLKRLWNKIVNYHMQLTPPADVRTALESIESLYNKGCRTELMNFKNDYIQFATKNGRATKHSRK